MKDKEKDTNQQCSTKAVVFFSFFSMPPDLVSFIFDHCFFPISIQRCFCPTGSISLSIMRHITSGQRFLQCRSLRGANVTTLSSVRSATAAAASPVVRQGSATSVQPQHRAPSRLRTLSTSGLAMGAQRTELLRYASSSAPGTKIIPFKLADIGEGLLEVELSEWVVKPGDTVEEFDKLCLTHSDKANYAITTPYDGIIRKLHIEPGKKVRVGQPLCDIEVENSVPGEGTNAQESHGEATASSSTSAAPTPTTSKGAAQSDLSMKTFATPAGRCIAKENKIDLSKVTGTGKAGRIMKEDILNYIASGGKGSSDKASSGTATSPASPVLGLGAVPEDKVVPIRGVQKAMVQSMKRALEIPAFGAMDEIDMGRLIATRNELRHELKSVAPELKLSFMPFFLKAASLALTDFPMLNAHTNDDCTEVTWKGSHNIGFAMDTPAGLLVPVVKNVQALSILDVARELDRLIAAGKAGKLTTADMTGGTFVLSNIGSIGATYTSPVIFPPQVAIGALGKAQKLPRFDKNNSVYAAEIVNVSWSADHRVVDGATMVRFSNAFKRYCESPSLMLLRTR